MGARRYNGCTELSPELPAQIPRRVGPDGTSTVKRKGVSDLMVPVPYKEDSFAVNLGGTADFTPSHGGRGFLFW